MALGKPSGPEDNFYMQFYSGEDYVHIEPINGVVQPPVIPPSDRPIRLTNQLEYIMNNILIVIWNHKYGPLFHKPVDAVKLNLPNYHKIVRTPMDLGTIKKRMENHYYISSKECIKDFNTMFTNCYVYYRPGENVVIMAQTLEKLFLSKIVLMPRIEIVLDPFNGRRVLSTIQLPA